MKTALVACFPSVYGRRKIKLVFLPFEYEIVSENERQKKTTETKQIIHYSKEKKKTENSYSFC